MRKATSSGRIEHIRSFQTFPDRKSSATISERWSRTNCSDELWLLELPGRVFLPRGFTPMSARRVCTMSVLATRVTVFCPQSQFAHRRLPDTNQSDVSYHAGRRWAPMELQPSSWPETLPSCARVSHMLHVLDRGGKVRYAQKAGRMGVLRNWQRFCPEMATPPT